MASSRTGLVWVAGAAILAAGAWAAAAQAHHGRTGAYDVSVPIAIEGVVTQAAFAPPHPSIVVQVPARRGPDAGAGMPGYEGAGVVVRSADAGRAVTVEFSPLPQFNALSERVRPGQTIRIMAFRNCRAPHQLRGHWVRTADGTVAMRDTRPTAAVNGCPPAG